jgi:hypothetical protein
MKFVTVLPLLLALSAAAEEAPPPAPKQVDEQPPKRFEAARQSADAGAFQPFSAAARIEGRATISLLSGYDTSYGAAVGTIKAEVRVWGPIAINAGATWVPDRLTIWPTAGLRVQALKQERSGIDLSVGAQYKAEGLTEGSADGELEAIVAVGRRFGRLGLLLNGVFGSDFEGNDRDGEVRFSGQYTFTDRVRAGLDSRVRFDLGSSDLAANRKATVDVVAGPTASVMVGPAILVATVGYSGTRLYGSPYANGVIAMGGIGAGF